jgi:ribosomal protein S12 methylthiotransferase
VDVLIEGPSPESDLVWQARMATQAPDIDGVCYLEDAGDPAPVPGQIRRMRVTRTHDYDLIGDLIDEPPAHIAPSLPLNPFPIIQSSAGHARQHQ